MKKSASQNKIKILALLGAMLLPLAGCAPPPSSNALQQRIDELLQVQQEQARQLEQLRQQLAGLQVPPAAAATPPPLDTVSQPAAQAPAVVPTLPQAPSAEEIAALSASAALYLESFAAIATGKMAEARDGFTSFVARFPEHEYVGNARYWLAEALLALNETQRGETLLLDIIDTPSQQHKAPAAMARLIAYYRETGSANNARAMLDMLSSRFPDSPELKRLLRSDAPQ